MRTLTCRLHRARFNGESFRERFDVLWLDEGRSRPSTLLVVQMFRLCLRVLVRAA